MDGIYFVKTGLDLDQKEKISDLIEVAFTFCDMNGADFGRSVTFKNRFNEQISLNLSDGRDLGARLQCSKAPTLG